MTNPNRVQLHIVSCHSLSDEAFVQEPTLGTKSRLWPTCRVRPVLLEASISQAFASSRILEPVRRQLAARRLFSFGSLVGMTRDEIFEGTPSVFKVRQAFVAELEALGFVFSRTPLPVRPWRRWTLSPQRRSHDLEVPFCDQSQT